jgi:hypothetical protein
MTELHADTHEIGMPQSRTGWASLLLVGFLATAVDIAAYYLLKEADLGQAARTAIGFLPLPPDLVLLVMVLHRIRRLDEFQRRIQLEAVGVGFLGTGVAVFTYGYLHLAGAVGALTMPLVWAFMLIFYGVGYLLALKRYQ